MNLFCLLVAAYALGDSHGFHGYGRASYQNPRSLTNPSKAEAPLNAVNGEKAISDEDTNYNFIGLNTNSDAPYVPSGMSPEQYKKIKETEAARLQKMDFGAWGPRFKRTDAPEGDWMVQTNLWVRGFQAGGKPSSVILSKEEMEKQETRQRRLETVRTALVSFMLAYAVLDILLLAFTTIRSGSTARRLFSSILARHGIPQAMRQHALASILFGKLQCFKLAAASLAVPLVTKYRETSYRKLWSKRRIFGTPMVVSVLVVSVKVALEMGLSLFLRG